MFEEIDKLYALMPSGLRSIGEWFGVIYPDMIDHNAEKYGFNEKQIEHGKAVIEKFGQAIIMKEAYAQKWRIHSPKSFAYFVLCNIEGILVGSDELNSNENEIKCLCKEIVEK